MLKLIRGGLIENRWFFGIIMGGIALAFIISLGWDQFRGETGSAIAQVDKVSIPMDEYQRAYQSQVNFYREIFQDKFDDKSLRKRVVEELIGRRLWVKEARNMNLSVTDSELKEAITNIPAFQKDGKFNPEFYRSFLKRERYTPESFERLLREELLIEKAKTLVKDAVALTPSEVEEAKNQNPSNPDPDRAASDLLMQKKQKALMAYTEALKQKASITIKDELL